MEQDNLLRYDTSGFIIGNRRMSEGIDRISDDTHEIVQILKSQNQIANTRMSELSRAIKNSLHRDSAQARVNETRERAARQNTPRTGTNDIERADPRVTRRQARLDRSSNQRQSRRNTPPLPPTTGTPSQNPDTRQPNNRRSSTGQPSPVVRERDANGRWIRAGSNNDAGNDTGNGAGRRERDANGRFSSDSKTQSGFNRLSSEIKQLGTGGLAGGSIDPVLDSLKEAKDLLAPVGRATKLAGKGVKLSYSKLKALKRREPVPAEQDRHNRENEKLLEKIWKAIKKQGNGNGGGLLGGLLGGAGAGGLLKKGLGLAKRNRGVIGAVAGAGLLASNWGDSTNEEKGTGIGGIAGGLAGAGAGAAMGATAGSAFPVVGTIAGGVAGGLIGGFLGTGAGEAMGQLITPYVSRWSDSLTDYKLPEKMEETWEKGLNPVFSSFNKLGAKTRTSISGLWDKVKNFLSGGGSSDGGGGDGYTDPNYGTEAVDPSMTGIVTAKASKAADLITSKALTRSSGYCARYVRKGLQDAGYDLKTVGAAKNYNNGALTDAGFSKIDNNSKLQKGDVMVFPAQGKHTAGHIQVYNGNEHVSDFRQGKKLNPWNDIDDKNLKYTTYRDLRGQKAATGAAGASSKSAGAKSNRETEAMDFFLSRGYSKLQASGIVANLHKETGGFREDVIAGKPTGRGDGGKAVGIAQWHPPRQKDFQKTFGKSLIGASFQDQLKFVDHELRKGGVQEKEAGKRLKSAKTPAEAAGIVSQYYERPAAVEPEKRARGQIAERIYRDHNAKPTAKATTPASNIKANNGFAPASTGEQITDIIGKNFPQYGIGNLFQTAAKAVGISPASLPATPMLKIPAMPKVQQRLDSGSNTKPLVVQASNDSINQNVSDRGLAHAITGGLGQETRYG